MGSLFDPDAEAVPEDEEENGGRNPSRSRTKTRSRGPSPRSPSTRRCASADDSTMDTADDCTNDSTASTSSKKRRTYRKRYSSLGPAQKIRRQDHLLEETPEQLLYDTMIRGLKKKKQNSAAESIEAILEDPELNGDLALRAIIGKYHYIIFLWIYVFLSKWRKSNPIFDYESDFMLFIFFHNLSTSFAFDRTFFQKRF